MPNISFFIPAYNCSTTIAESVDSIMASNFIDGDELIIVNDCSTDNTVELLQSLKAKYPLINIIHHSRNKGGGAARNTGVENAKHEHLFCLDSDNVLEKDCIRPMLKFLREQNADVVFFNELRYFSTDIAILDETWFYEPGIFNIEDLLSGKASPGGSGNYLFTKNSWIKAKGYEEGLGALDTWAFGFKQLIENCKMAIMPGTYYFHRREHDSYYMRDAWSRRKSVSLRLIKLIINYIDRINPDDVNYIFSKRGRYTWFDNLQKRPIRIVNEHNPKAVWQEHDINNGRLKKIVNKARHYKTRLSQISKKSK